MLNAANETAVHAFLERRIGFLDIAATVERTVPYAREISELTFGDLSPEERVAVVALLRKLSGIR